MTAPKQSAERFPPLLAQAIGFDAVLRLEATPGSSIVRYVARIEHTHSGGRIVQGGFVTAWLDNSMAYAVYARDPETTIASLDLTASFLERIGQGPIVAQARVLRWGGRVVFLESELYPADAAGGPDVTRGPLARATSTAMLVRSH